MEDDAQSLARQSGGPPRPITVHQASLQIIRRDEVLWRCGSRKTTLCAAMAEGRFPKAVHLGPRAVGWLAHEIDEWIALRVAESRLPARPVASTRTPGTERQ
ncbi:MAG: AlpA family phage regulatory protein [Polyangia bacterium]